MKNRIKTHNNQQTWSQIVGLVQGANMRQINFFKKQQQLRKMAYKNQLDQQIKEHRKIDDSFKNKKLRQKTQLQQQVKIQKTLKTIEKIKKLKTEQKYRYQNLQLAKLDKRNSYDMNKYPENPFVSLVQGEDLRKRQTRNNFKLQNKINQIQSEILQIQRKQQKQNDKKIRKQFQDFVQNQFSKKQRQRQKLKNNCLQINQWQSIDFETIQNELPQKKYIRFLNKQTQQQKHKRYEQKRQTLDSRSSDINKHIYIPDSSPAYLGRNSYANDRKRQLSIIDSQLNTRAQIKFRSGSQLYTSIDQYQGDKGTNKKIASTQVTPRKIQSNFKFLPSISIQKSLLIQNPEYVQPQKIQTNRKCNTISTEQSIYSPQISKSVPTKQRRNYYKLDPITGKQTSILI